MHIELFMYCMYVHRGLPDTVLETEGAMVARAGELTASQLFEVTSGACDVS
jgi:hypothetical protein